MNRTYMSRSSWCHNFGRNHSPADSRLGGGRHQSTTRLGDDKFTERVLASLGEEGTSTPTIETLIEVVCREYDVEQADLAAKGRSRMLAEARAMIGWLAIRAGSDSLTNIAKRFGRQSNTLSEAVKKLRYRARHSEVLVRRMYNMTSELGIRSELPRCTPAHINHE